MKEEFAQLGIIFKGKHGRKGGSHEDGERQRVAGKRATRALWKRCNEIDLSNAIILRYLYGTLLQPILQYGCEVWAPDQSCSSPSEHVHDACTDL